MASNALLQQATQLGSAQGVGVLADARAQGQNMAAQRQQMGQNALNFQNQQEDRQRTLQMQEQEKRFGPIRQDYVEFRNLPDDNARDQAWQSGLAQHYGQDPNSDWRPAIANLLRTPGFVPQEIVQKEMELLLAPKQQEPYTLSPGSQRRGPDNRLLAEAPREAPQQATDRELVAVTGPDGMPVLVPRPQAAGMRPAQNAASATIDKKLAAGRPQANLRLGAVTQTLDRLETAMDELYRDPGLTRITGTVAGRTPNLTNTATGAQTKLDSITSQLFVNALQAMREASKTGGAVGNVSDREGDKLERTIAALGQAQSTEDFQKQLSKAINELRLSKELIRRAYEDQYGEPPPEQPEITPYAPGQPQGGPPAAPTAPRVVDW